MTKQTEIETTEIETETLKCDDLAHDEEFMDDLDEQMTPEKAEKRRKQLNSLIEQAQKKVDELQNIYETNKAGGIQVLKDFVKENLTKQVDEEDIKEIGKGKQQLESVIVVQGLIANYTLTYNSAQTDIRQYTKELNDLKNVQISLEFVRDGADAGAAEVNREVLNDIDEVAEAV